MPQTSLMGGSAILLEGAIDLGLGASCDLVGTYRKRFGLCLAGGSLAGDDTGDGREGAPVLGCHSLLRGLLGCLGYKFTL